MKLMPLKVYPVGELVRTFRAVCGTDSLYQRFHYHLINSVVGLGRRHKRAMTVIQEDDKEVGLMEVQCPIGVSLYNSFANFACTVSGCRAVRVGH